MLKSIVEVCQLQALISLNRGKSKIKLKLCDMGVFEKKSTISDLARTCLILCIYMFEHTKQQK